MKYDLILFDLDDTLLCFQTAQRNAFRGVLNRHGVSENVETMFERYKVVAHGLWERYERKEISREDVRLKRYMHIIEEFSLNHLDPRTLSEMYLHLLTFELDCIPHAENVCASLSKGAELIVVTNGFADAEGRVARSKLGPYFQHVITPEAAGAAKPDPRIFEYAFRLAEKFDSKKTLMVGDTLAADVLGAAQIGIDSVWFNPNNKPKDLDIHPTYTIGALNELLQIMD